MEKGLKHSKCVRKTINFCGYLSYNNMRKVVFVSFRSNLCERDRIDEQAGAELGQALLKLGLDFNVGSQLNLH